MSNFLLRDPDCVFIHIPKTAGTSIRKGVWESRYEGPVFGGIPTEWKGLYSFAFVRHPLQRMVSAYKMFTEGAKGDTNWKLPPDARPLTIEAFVEIVTDESIIYDDRRKTFEEKIRHHTIPQTHDFNCLKEAKFIGRYERLDEDFNTVLKQMNMERHLPKMHTTTPVQWQDLLQGSLLERCIEFYREDFRSLEYEL